MGLDWYAVPHIGAETIVESPNEYEYPTVFRGHTVVTSSLPDSIVQEGWTSKHPSSMKSFSSALERELTQNTEKYDEVTIQEIEDAISWLDYWSGQEKCMETEW